MASVSFTRCDGCGVTVENPSSVPGWIRIDGRSILRYVGRRSVPSENVGYRSVSVVGTDFCSMRCLVETLDSKGETPVDPKCIRHADCRKSPELARECLWGDGVKRRKPTDDITDEVLLSPDPDLDPLAPGGETGGVPS